MSIELGGYQANGHDTLSALVERSSTLVRMCPLVSKIAPAEFLGMLRKDHEEIAALCEKAQEARTMPSLNGDETRLLQQIGQSLLFAKSVPVFELQHPDEALAFIARRAREAGISYAKELIEKFPRAVPYVADMMHTKYRNEIYRALQSEGVGISYQRSQAVTQEEVPAVVTLRRSEKKTFSLEKGGALYSALFMYTLITALGSAETLLAQHTTPRNPILHFAGIHDIQRAPTREQMHSLGLCMDVMEKVVYIASYFMPYGDDFLADRERRAGYRHMLAAGSSFLQHGLFFNAPGTQVQAHPALVNFYRDCQRHAQEKVRIISKKEGDVSIEARDLNEALWDGGNREDAAALSETLQWDGGSIMFEHITRGGLERSRWYESQIDQLLRLEKRGVDGAPIPYTPDEQKMLDALRSGSDENAVVRLLRAIHSNPFTFAGTPIEEMLDFVFELVNQFKPDMMAKDWDEVLGYEPAAPEQKRLIVLASMREEQRVAFFKHQRHETYANSNPLLALRASVFRGRAYWENGAHAPLFANGKQPLVSRFERLIPAFATDIKKLDMLKLMILLEKVKLLMKDFNVVPPSQYGALDAAIAFLQNTDIITAVYQEAVPWPHIPAPTESLLMKLSRKKT